MDQALVDLLAGLAARRPLFHSEADFQHELAWEARASGVADAVRLERPHDTPSGRIAVDLVLRRAGEQVAIELKYWKRRLQIEVDGERFELKETGARDLCGYDLWSDVARLERLVDAGVYASGWTIALTNDPGFWTPARERNVGAAFCSGEGRTVRGPLVWAAHAGPGTTAGRTEAIELAREHVVRWRDYSEVAGHRFRWCAVAVRR